MLFVSAKVGPSCLRGIGLISQQVIPKGTKVWEFVAGFDILVPQADLDKFSQAAREQIIHYAYLHRASKTFVLSGDDDRFTNHSDDPNTCVAGNCTLTARNIQPGEEITSDYDELAALDYGSDYGSSIYVDRCVLGLGIFATRAFQEGEFICRFNGPIISLAESISKGHEEDNHLQVGPITYVDLHSPGVFINHRCDPNAGIRHDTQLVALRAICHGEEIRFDYSTTASERRWTMRCRCESQSCRGSIGDFHDLPQEIQKRYFDLGIVQAFIVHEAAIRRLEFGLGTARGR